MRRNHRWSSLAIVLLVCGARVGRAQSDEERAAARSTAQQGLVAWKEGRHADAVDLLKRAEAVVHAPTHLLYIARSYEKLGKLVSARETYLKLINEQLALDASKAFRDAKTSATKELAELEPRIAYLTIVVTGPHHESARLLIDDVQVPQALIGMARPSDAGTHKYQAFAEGMESEISTATIEERSKKTVTLTLHAAAGGPPKAAETTIATAAPAKSEAAGAPSNAAAPGASSTSEPHAPSGVSTLRISSYLVLGAGIVSVGVGGYFMYLRKVREGQADSLFSACNPHVCTQEEQQQINNIDLRANAATRSGNVAFLVGAGALVLGTAMLVIDLSNPPPATGLRMHPWIGAGSVGLDGTF